MSVPLPALFSSWFPIRRHTLPEQTSLVCIMGNTQKSFFPSTQSKTARQTWESSSRSGEKPVKWWGGAEAAAAAGGWFWRCVSPGPYLALWSRPSCYQRSLCRPDVPDWPLLAVVKSPTSNLAGFWQWLIGGESVPQQRSFIYLHHKRAIPAEIHFSLRWTSRAVQCYLPRPHLRGLSTVCNFTSWEREREGGREGGGRM